MENLCPVLFLCRTEALMHLAFWTHIKSSSFSFYIFKIHFLLIFFWVAYLNSFKPSLINITFSSHVTMVHFTWEVSSFIPHVWNLELEIYEKCGLTNEALEDSITNLHHFPNQFSASAKVINSNDDNWHQKNFKMTKFSGDWKYNSEGLIFRSEGFSIYLKHHHFLWETEYRT